MAGMAIHWGMVINNYDATDVALVQQGYPDHIRQIVYSYEIGKECGTPHIQAFIRLKRQERLSYMKKLYPRGNFKMLSSQEYVLNAQRYAQKLDKTANGKATITNWEPIHTIESVMKRVVEMMLYSGEDAPDPNDRCSIMRFRRQAEKELVLDDYRYAKVFVSATYKSMWNEFGNEIFENLWNTHTHTHSDKKFSREGGITEDAGGSSEDATSQDEPDTQGDEDSEGDEEGEGDTDEGHDEGAGDDASEGTDISQ